MATAGIPIYIVRHGCTDLNETQGTSVDRIRGWSDVPLNDQGRKEAGQVADQLKNKGIRSIVTSDLSRAAETASIIGQKLGITPATSQKLRPWNLGEFQGVETNKVLPHIEQYVRNPNMPVPGGESFKQFHDRAFAGIDEAAQSLPPPIALVTHHRVERLFQAWEKTGQENPSLDLKSFLDKGETTGHAEQKRLSWFPGSQTPVNAAPLSVAGAAQQLAGQRAG